MDYRLLSPGEPLPVAVRRIAREQVDDALYRLDHLESDPETAVHEARKRMKQLRALLRLTRGALGELVYRRENLCFRNTARMLAGTRDAQVAVATLDKLRGTAPPAARYGFTQLRRRLVAAAERATSNTLQEQGTRLAAREILLAAHDRIADWPLHEDRFGLLAPGLRRIYTQGRRRLRRAASEDTEERYHEWRKRAKDLWYHVRILQTCWPEELDAATTSLHRLSDLLGDEHDLSELRRRLSGDDSPVPASSDLAAALDHLEARQAEMRRGAKALGDRLWAEKPGAYVRRMAAYFAAWREDPAVSPEHDTQEKEEL